MGLINNAKANKWEIENLRYNYLKIKPAKPN
jgi:hypothetical protein